jgi:hypothetical protein
MLTTKLFLSANTATVDYILGPVATPALNSPCLLLAPPFPPLCRKKQQALCPLWYPLKGHFAKCEKFIRHLRLMLQMGERYLKYLGKARFAKCVGACKIGLGKSSTDGMHTGEFLTKVAGCVCRTLSCLI